MRKLGLLLLLAIYCGAAAADDTRDIFKGKLFPPNVVLEHRGELELSRDQFREIRATVVEVQTQVAEHEWDMQEAYTNVLDALDRQPLDESAIRGHVKAVLAAENAVKLAQLSMLIRIRNLLTEEQVAFLEANWSRDGG